MRLAILCPGPSLTDSAYDPDAFDLTIAVNTAALSHPCDWMCAVDRDLIQRAVPRYVNGLVRGFASNPAWMRHLEFLGFKVRPLLPYSHYTFPNALWFALTLYPESIDVFGFDCTDTPHADGSIGTIGEERWRKELPDVRAAMVGQRVSLHGRASAEILAYVLGEREDLVL